MEWSHEALLWWRCDVCLTPGSGGRRRCFIWRTGFDIGPAASVCTRVCPSVRQFWCHFGILAYQHRVTEEFPFAVFDTAGRTTIIPWRYKSALKRRTMRPWVVLTSCEEMRCTRVLSHFFKLRSIARSTENHPKTLIYICSSCPLLHYQTLRNIFFYYNYYKPQKTRNIFVSSGMRASRLEKTQRCGCVLVIYDEQHCFHVCLCVFTMQWERFQSGSSASVAELFKGFQFLTLSQFVKHE